MVSYSLVSFLIAVLAKPANGVPNRAGKSQKKGDWEAELRAEIQKKKGVTQKLSPKDQALVNEQIVKESSIRKRVEQARRQVQSGTGIINSLINIPSNLGVELWYFRALSTLEDGAVEKTVALVGSSVVVTYLVRFPLPFS